MGNDEILSKEKVICAEGDYGGVSGYNYYQFKGTKLVEKAHRTGTYNMNTDKTTYKYYVNKKKVSKSKYTAYIKKLTKGDQAKSFSKLKWKKY